MEKIIKNLKKNGFVNSGKMALSEMEVKELAMLSRQTFDYVRKSSTAGVLHPDYIPPTTGVEGVMRLPQLNARIAELIDKVFSDASVSTILTSVLGLDYKIWAINYRKSVPGDRGLGVHQDSFGETNLCIVLESNPKGHGSTIFLAGSHLIPSRLKKLKFSSNVIRFLSPLFARLSGNAGDIAFFFNRTWHGRSNNSSDYTYDVIFISLYPSGASFTFEGYGEWSHAFLNMIKGTRLGKLVDPSQGTIKLENNRYKVLNSTGLPSSSFAIDIETNKLARIDINYCKLHLCIWLLKGVHLARPLLKALKLFLEKT
jgi:non-heme Fe2+,alpha-ketoglutarate-dependent halogenase